MAGLMTMKRTAQTHSQLQPRLRPRASGSSGLGANFTWIDRLMVGRQIFRMIDREAEIQKMERQTTRETLGIDRIDKKH